MTSFIASILGPVVGGFKSHAKEWRWTFWPTTIITGAFEIGYPLLYREIYRVIILSKKSAATTKVNRKLSTADRLSDWGFSNQAVDSVSVSTDQASFYLLNYPTGIHMRSFGVKLHLYSHNHTHWCV